MEPPTAPIWGTMTLTMRKVKQINSITCMEPQDTLDDDAELLYKNNCDKALIGFHRRASLIAMSFE